MVTRILESWIRFAWLLDMLELLVEPLCSVVTLCPPLPQPSNHLCFPVFSLLDLADNLKAGFSL